MGPQTSPPQFPLEIPKQKLLVKRAGDVDEILDSLFFLKKMWENKKDGSRC